MKFCPRFLRHSKNILNEKYSRGKLLLPSKDLNTAASQAEMDPNPNPFYRHCDKVTETPVEGKVIRGKIPAFLKGHLIRNGPGIQKVGKTTYDHFFDGLAILHKFTIDDGKAYYQSRALESEARQRNLAANRIVVGEFGTVEYPDPCQSLFGRLQSRFVDLMGKSEKMEMTDNCNVNVAYYGDQLYAMTETVFIRRIDPKTLKCVGDKTRIRDHCAINTATAHPHELESGTLLNMGNNYRHKNGPRYCFVTIPPKFGSDETAYKEAKIIGEIPSRWKMHPAYAHSFGMTMDKIVFIEQPLCLDIKSIMAAPIFNTTFENALKWYPNEKTLFHIISMKDGKKHLISYQTDKLMTFHHINTYEENGFLFVDVAGYDDANTTRSAKASELNTKKSNSPVKGAGARRYILPLNVDGAKPGENLVKAANSNATAVLRKGSTSIVDVTPHKYSDWFELPRINYGYNGKKYKFMYGLRSSETKNVNSLPKADLISKINAEDGNILNYKISESGAMATEPIFVPAINPTSEDDGVILSAILQKNKTEVDLVILNAKDLKEISCINFHAEGAVTSTFHGLWKNSI